MNQATDSKCAAAPVKVAVTINPYARHARKGATAFKAATTRDQRQGTASLGENGNQAINKQPPIIKEPQQMASASAATTVTASKRETTVKVTKHQTLKLPLQHLMVPRGTTTASLKARLKRQIAQLKKGKAKKARASNLKPSAKDKTASEPRPMTMAPPNVQRPVATRMSPLTGGLPVQTLTTKVQPTTNIMTVTTMTTAEENKSSIGFPPLDNTKQTEAMSEIKTPPSTNGVATLSQQTPSCNSTSNVDMSVLRQLQQPLHGFNMMPLSSAQPPPSFMSTAHHSHRFVMSLLSPYYLNPSNVAGYPMDPSMQTAAMGPSHWQNPALYDPRWPHLPHRSLPPWSASPSSYPYHMSMPYASPAVPPGTLPSSFFPPFPSVNVGSTITPSPPFPPYPPVTVGLTITPSPPALKETDPDGTPLEPLHSWKESIVKSPMAVPTTTDSTESRNDPTSLADQNPASEELEALQARDDGCEEKHVGCEGKNDACIKDEVVAEDEKGRLAEMAVATRRSDDIKAPELMHAENFPESSEEKSHSPQKLDRNDEVTQAATPLIKTLTTSCSPQHQETSKATFPGLSNVVPNYPASNLSFQNGLFQPFMHQNYPYLPWQSNQITSPYPGAFLPGPYSINGGPCALNNMFSQASANYKFPGHPHLPLSSSMFPSYPQSHYPNGFTSINSGVVNHNVESSFKDAGISSSTVTGCTELRSSDNVALIHEATNLSTTIGNEETNNCSKSTSPKEKTCILSVKPMDAPSPFASTHHVIPQTVIVTKAGADASFGITLKSVEVSILVDRPESEISLSKVAPETANNALATTTNTLDDIASLGGVDPTASLTPSKSSRCRRRKRVYFVVMKVIDLSSQYERFPIDSDKRLQLGDVILSIQDKLTGGLPFVEAIKLFQSETFDQGNDGTLMCRLRVARPNAPFVKAVEEPVGRPVPLNGPLTISEIEAMAKAFMMAYGHPSRHLGCEVTPDLVSSCLMVVSPGTMNRNVIALFNEWRQHVIPDILDRMSSNAQRHWKLLNASNETDLARSQLRALPRQPKGCRCGASDHEYVNDPKCLLYSNLRALDCSRQDFSVQLKGKHVHFPRSKKKLSAIGVAYRNRLEELISKKVNLRVEENFVKRMEGIQVQQLRQAIFAPSLAVMILSAVAAYEEEIASKTALEQLSRIDHNDDSDDDEDTPLAALGRAIRDVGDNSDVEKLKKEDTESRPSAPGKRVHKVDIPSCEKRQKTGSVSEKPSQAPAGQQSRGHTGIPINAATEVKLHAISCECLAWITRHISFTWGHCFREPSHRDFAW